MTTGKDPLIFQEASFDWQSFRLFSLRDSEKPNATFHSLFLTYVKDIT